MTLLRLLNPQGIAGIAASLCLAILFVIQRGETRHWKSESGRYEQLYAREQSAFATTTANYRAAAEQARGADKANAERAAAEQRAISQRSQNALESRLADARARAEQLRLETSERAADPRPGGAASVPGVPSSAGGTPETSGQDGLPSGDALTATEQAIQLDELIKWVKAQTKVDPNAEE